MKIVVLAPRVVQNYIAQFPEVQRNAYHYFNYDHRVVEERVDRGDQRPPYKYADDLTNQDYDCLLSYAKTIQNPILMKYDQKVACEDALHTAIRSFQNGLFDGKVNADRFAALLKAFMNPTPQPVGTISDIPMGPVQAKKKDIPVKPKKEPQDTITLKPHEVRRLNIPMKKIPTHNQVRKVQRGVPHIVRDDKGKIQVKINK